METRIIDLNDFELSGGGKLGESYTHKSDSNILLKQYFKELEELGLEEYGRSCHENPSKVAPVDRAVIVSPN